MVTPVAMEMHRCDQTRSVAREKHLHDETSLLRLFVYFKSYKFPDIGTLVMQ